MSEVIPALPTHGAEPILAWIDDVADAFEAEWQNGEPPAIARFLEAANEERRRALLDELVQIDLEYRLRAGERRCLADYAREFPELVGRDGVNSGRLVDQTEGEPAQSNVPRRLGDFELVEVLGQGGFGVVYKAFDGQLGRWVAIKILRAGAVASLDERKRFLREARSAAELTHPHIVQVHSIGHDGETPYIVSEFIEGPTLAEAIEQKRFGFRETAEMVAQLADALDYAHRHKIIHRDINAANVLTDAAGRPHLTDFGLARRQEASVAVTLDGELLGTPAYMAPEQAAGNASTVDGRCDIYGLGVILYQMLTGELPFRGTARVLLHQVINDEPPQPRRFNELIPYDLETICLKAMSKLPSGRYTTSGALAGDLRRYLAGETILARRAGLWERGRKWVWRRPMQAAAAVASLVAAACLLLAAWYGIQLRAAEKVAAVEVQAARQASATQTYYSLVTQVRDARARPEPGWTWAGLANLRQAAALPTPVRDAEQLRSEAAACLAAFDLREVAVLAKDVAPCCLAFSPDGKRLAIGPLRGTSQCAVPVYAVESHRLELALTYPRSAVNGEMTGVRRLAFSPDGHWLLAGTRSGQIHAWDLRPSDDPAVTKQTPAISPRFSWNAHGDEVTSLEFNRDGAILFSGSNDKTIKRWDRSDQWRLVSCLPTEGRVSDLSCSGDGRLLACGSPGGLKFADAERLEFLPGANDVAKSTENFRACFSPDGRILASTDRWGIVLLDTRIRRVLLELRDPDLLHAHEDDISELHFSPDGSLLVSGAADRKIKIWEVASGRLLLAITALGVGSVHPIFSPDGRFLAVTGNRQTLLYELRTMRVQELVGHHVYPVRAIAYSPDGHTLACLAEETAYGGNCRGEVTLWAVASGLLKRREDVPISIARDARSPSSIAYRPDGNALAFTFSGTRRKTFFVWDLNTGERRAPAEDGKTVSLSFARNGKTIWSAGNRGNQVNSWRVPELSAATGWSNANSRFGDGRTSVYCVSAGSEWAIAGSWDGSVKVFRESDGSLISEWPCPGGPVFCVCLSKDESWFAAGAQNGSVYVVRVRGGQLIAELKGHRDSVDAVSFGGDGHLLATGSRDSTVRIWQRTGESLRQVLTLPSLTGPVVSVRFSPDDNQLAVLIKNELAVRIWDLAGVREKLAGIGLGW